MLLMMFIGVRWLLMLVVVQIPNRTQFKHVVFGPQLWSGYDEAFFPAVRDLVDAEAWDDANKYIAKTASLMKKAAAVLEL